MHSSKCPSPDALVAWSESPAGDARREHVDQCPRCRTQLASYRAFMRGDEVPGARTAEADAQLADALAREIHGRTDAAPARRVVEARRSPWAAFAALFAPVRRPVWALAVVAIAVSGAWWFFPHAPSEPVMRGAGSAQMIVTPAPVRSGEALTLAWKPVEGADTYAVHFYGTDLSDLAELDAGPEQSLTLRRGELPTGLPAGTKVLWQVVAAHGHDVLASSRTQSIVLP